MNFQDISLPEIYKSSADFRFFLEWFNLALTKIKYDIENLGDIYDPLRCPNNLLWMLGDTMGFKFDNRVSVAFNRLVILYFMSLIRNKGSLNGIKLGAELNLAQHTLGAQSEVNPELWNRLEDTSIPTNSVYVTSDIENGYITVVYFSTKLPIDTCIDYVRPLGMYCFQSAGVRMDSATCISLDARLTEIGDAPDIGSDKITFVANYTRDDYAKLQKIYSDLQLGNIIDSNGNTIDGIQLVGRPATPINGLSEKIVPSEGRNPVYERNSVVEESSTNAIDPGFRTLYSLQLCNNTNIMKALIDPLFDIGVIEEVTELNTDKPFNLIVNENNSSGTTEIASMTRNVNANIPDTFCNRINPTMLTIGDAISLNDDNNRYTKVDENGNITIVDSDGDIIPPTPATESESESK